MAGAVTTEQGPGRIRVGGHTVRIWMVLVAAVTMLAGTAVRLRPGRHLGRAAVHPDRLRPQLVHDRGRHQLGDARCARRRARRRRLLADRLGRKNTGVVAGILFCAGAAIQALAPDTAVLVVGRFIVGFGVGVASVAAPLYAAEMAPTESRGGTCRPTSSRSPSASSSPTSSTDLLSELGQLAVDARRRRGARAFLLIIVMLAMPETPRWLMRAGRRDQARRVADQGPGSRGTSTPRSTTIQEDLGRRRGPGQLGRGVRQGGCAAR